jgi:PAS domain S-box-containing protein
VQKYQNKLLESRNRYKLISNNSADLICLHRPDGTYEFVSPSVINILGYTQKELIGKNPYQLFHPEDLKRIEEESHERARSGEAIKNIQYRIRKKNGNYIWFETATEPITDQHGEITKLQTSSREITERKRLENLLIDTNKLTFVGGWELDVESNELFWTEEVYRIHELPPDTPLEIDKAIGFYAEEDRELITKAVEKSLDTGQGYDLELTLITANGNRKWVRAIGKTRMDENGKVYQLYGVFQDLTARKTMEDKLRDRNEQLEKLMETTHEINSIIGHDLKTPLTSIVGLSDLALMELENVEDTEELEYFIKNIYNSSLGMGATLDDLLKWSILQTGVMEPSKEDISLVSISEELNDYFVSTCSNKGVELLFELNGVSNIHSDRQMIKTIIRNLISNAIKFSNPGDTITFGIDSKDEHTWQLSVADEGVGMDEETRSKLFSPNDHPSKRGTSNESGTGLGLRVTYRLINLLNGRIEVESELGKGTKISVYLPKE